jgi:hypothetical protein
VHALSLDGGGLLSVTFYGSASDEWLAEAGAA